MAREPAHRSFPKVAEHRDIGRSVEDYATSTAGMQAAERIATRPQTVTCNPEGRLRPLRIGDAGASRNAHAALYDGLRFARNF